MKFLSVAQAALLGLVTLSEDQGVQGVQIGEVSQMNRLRK